MKATGYALLSVFIALITLSSNSFADSGLAQYWSRSNQTSEISIDYGTWSQLLATYIEEKRGLNHFRYSEVTPADRDALKSYLELLQSVIVTELSERQQYAYWINLYNALTIKVILDHYPVKSIRDISYSLFSRGPWKKIWLRSKE